MAAALYKWKAECCRNKKNKVKITEIHGIGICTLWWHFYELKVFPDDFRASGVKPWDMDAI